MTDDILVKRFEPTDPRLGRHVRHDPRSLNYQIKAKDVDTLKSVRHERYIPTLDQGSLGCCTGTAAVGCLGTGFFWAFDQVKSVLSETDASIDVAYAIDIYSEATVWDSYPESYPPTDTGSDGLTIASVLTKRGFISGYVNGTSFEALLTSLSEQPVIVGTEWRNDMFTPEADGRIQISGSVVGGHEYVLDELDVDNRLVWMHQSWGKEWGIEGRAYFTWEDFEVLLAAQGDVTAFVPITQPAPQPTPVDPEPAPQPTPVDPEPEPAPQPTPVDPEPTEDPKSELQKLIDDIKASLDKLVNWFNR